MNPEIIGPLGYLGLGLGAAAVLCWVAYWKIKRRVVARAGLALALSSLVCAQVHSASHVDRIEVDPEIQRAAILAKQEERRQAALDMRGDEVAQIRFAEDDGDEFLDKAGLKKSDLEYYEGLEEPAWKKEKQQRSGNATEDDSLEARIGGDDAEGGADVAELETETPAEPILLSEAEVVRARQLDRWNLRLSLALPLLGLLVIGHDYLRRANRYAEASLPLPIPSSWPAAVTPMPAVVERPHPPRRSIPRELVWLTRRGDSLLYLTDQPDRADEAHTALQPRLAGGRRPDLFRIPETEVDDSFIFESLWFGRASFIVDSEPRTQALLTHVIEALQQRRATRARVRQVVHLVWDLDRPMPADTFQSLALLAERTGWSLFLCQPASSSNTRA